MNKKHSFSDEEFAQIEALLLLALKEDHIESDVTSRAIFSDDDKTTASIIAKEEIIFGGTEVLPKMLASCSDIHMAIKAQDGRVLRSGAVIAELTGPTIQLLALERTALNVLQRLCGVATLTGKYVSAVASTGAVILDTRKTIPGWRALDKYAVRCGGAQNHRMHLADAMMLKDNHIAAAGGIEAAMSKALAMRQDKNIPIIVECDTLAQLEKIIDQPVDRVLLDNMDVAELKRAVRLVGGRFPLEASGGVTLETVAEIAQTGVDYISVGAITHSAVAVDIGLDS